MENKEEYQKIFEEAKKYYRGLSKVTSPALGQEVHFNAKGFNHILYRKKQYKRSHKEQIRRFRLLSLAMKLIGFTNTYQEYEDTSKETGLLHANDSLNQSKNTQFWGLIAITEGRKIKVILRKVGSDGNVHFWSIIPSWKTNKRDDKLFDMKGNPFED